MFVGLISMGYGTDGMDGRKLEGNDIISERQTLVFFGAFPLLLSFSRVGNDGRCMVENTRRAVVLGC